MTEQKKCVACGGTGKASNGHKCPPCNGKGVKQEDTSPKDMTKKGKQ